MLLLPIGLSILANFAAHTALTLVESYCVRVANAGSKLRDHDSNGKGVVAMKHMHKPGCRCASCLSEFERRESAAQQLYDLLQMSWIGVRTAVAYAQFAREGIEEAEAAINCLLEGRKPDDGHKKPPVKGE